VEGPYIASAPPRFVVDLLKERFPGAVLDACEFRGEITVVVARDGLIDVARFLRDDPSTAFDLLSVVTGTHFLERDYDYEVLYHLYSLTKNHRLRLKVRLREGDTVPSVTPLWPGANWPEREVYDLVGVRFTGHPDLRRIIMPEDYPDHPLRKDFDVEGGPSDARPRGRAASPGFRDMESV
jgi:NADH-quinone oxidoreductase subunit C